VRLWANSYAKPAGRSQQQFGSLLQRGSSAEAFWAGRAGCCMQELVAYLVRRDTFLHADACLSSEETQPKGERVPRARAVHRPPGEMSARLLGM
jgi:hypothetical protein